MKPLRLLFLLPCLAFVMAQAQDKQPLSSVNDLQWQQRIILIWPSSQGEEKQQLDYFKRELAERHINWFLFENDGVLSNYQGAIKSDFRATTDKHYASYIPGMVLIGKDGGIKLTDEQLDLQAIFNEIDRMPMRQQEMKNQAEH